MNVTIVLVHSCSYHLAIAFCYANSLHMHIHLPSMPFLIHQHRIASTHCCCHGIANCFVLHLSSAAISAHAASSGQYYFVACCVGCIGCTCELSCSHCCKELRGHDPYEFRRWLSVSVLFCPCVRVHCCRNLPHSSQSLTLYTGFYFHHSIEYAVRLLQSGRASAACQTSKPAIQHTSTQHTPRDPHLLHRYPHHGPYQHQHLLYIILHTHLNYIHDDLKLLLGISGLPPHPGPSDGQPDATTLTLTTQNITSLTSGQHFLKDLDFKTPQEPPRSARKAPKSSPKKHQNTYRNVRIKSRPFYADKYLEFCCAWRVQLHVFGDSGGPGLGSRSALGTVGASARRRPDASTRRREAP